jgi:hypothetical protein
MKSLKQLWAPAKPRTRAALRRREKRIAYAAEGDAKIDAVGHWMRRLNSDERIAELVPFLAEAGLTDEQFWRIFLAIWPMCDAAYDWNHLLAELFEMHGPCPLGLLPDREFYDSLPKMLTVYRGADRSCVEEGISWTADRRVAEGFARGHRFIFNPDPVVATATIRKSEIFAAINDRNESEILCLPPDIEWIEAIVVDRAELEKTGKVDRAAD